VAGPAELDAAAADVWGQQQGGSTVDEVGRVGRQQLQSNSDLSAKHWFHNNRINRIKRIRAHQRASYNGGSRGAGLLEPEHTDWRGDKDSSSSHCRSSVFLPCENKDGAVLVVLLRCG
jgi:hypothetical protein